MDVATIQMRLEIYNSSGTGTAPTEKCDVLNV
jgi:hypothetical protein